MPQQKTASTSKWASGSKGVRLTIGVIPTDLQEAMRRCEEENVSPRSCGHRTDNGKFTMLITVVVPCRKDGVAEKCFVHEVLGQGSKEPLDVALFGVKENVDLTCPPEQKALGPCPVCGDVVDYAGDRRCATCCGVIQEMHWTKRD